MTGIVINNNEYTVSTGNTKIEYSSTGDSVSYSIYGENIPAISGIIDFKALSGTGTFTINKTGNYRLVLVGGGAGGCSKIRSERIIYLMPGSSGGVFDGIVELNKGTYTYSIGAGGYGSGNASGTTGRSGNGGDTTLSFNNSVIATVGGATGGYWWNRSSTNVGFSVGNPGAGISGTINIISSTVSRAGNQGVGETSSNWSRCSRAGAQGYSPSNDIEKRGSGGDTVTSGGTVQATSGVGGLLWIVNL